MGFENNRAWTVVCLCLSCLSVILCTALVARMSCGRKPRHTPVLVRQFSQLALATAVSEGLNVAGWYTNLRGWACCVEFCLGFQVAFRWARLWGCLVTAHIAIGLAVATAHQIPFLRKFMKLLPWIPLLSVPLVLPQVLTPVRTSWPLTPSEAICLGSQLQEAVFVISSTISFVCMAVSCVYVACRIRFSAPRSVLRRVTANALTLVLVYMLSWAGCWVFDVVDYTFPTSQFLTVWWWPNCLLTSARGIMEAVAYWHLVKKQRGALPAYRKRHRSRGVELTSSSMSGTVDRRNFDVDFSQANSYYEVEGATRDANEEAAKQTDEIEFENASLFLLQQYKIEQDSDDDSLSSSPSPCRL
mmetsp:Transcript_47177/g.125001  ORF Transcript_47177/g.125001 Transcript_47177/m.125001 type:complete len:358 (+) Transcript_47177:36-1109(+)